MASRIISASLPALVATYLAFGVAGSLADEGGAPSDPTDPINIVSSVTASFDYVEFDNNQGSSSTYAVEGWIPLSQRDLATIELRYVDPNINRGADDVIFGDDFGISDLSEAGDDSSGFGDARLRYFRLYGVPGGETFRAWAPSLDLVLPLGDPDKGTGGDYWIIAPNVVFAFDLSERISAYTFVRYVHGIPTENQDDINAINVELPLSFTLADATFLTVTPNVFFDFGESDAEFLTSKFGLTQMLSEAFGLTLEGNLPIAGDSGLDYGVKLAAFAFF